MCFDFSSHYVFTTLLAINKTVGCRLVVGVTPFAWSQLVQRQFGASNRVLYFGLLFQIKTASY
jgi:hypothetical protein